jgi:hypothetical protein
VTLKRLVLLWTLYCQSHQGEVLIDFTLSIAQKVHHEGTVLHELKDVVQLFVSREDMSRRTAYDYAKAILAIQKSVSVLV